MAKLLIQRPGEAIRWGAKGKRGGEVGEAGFSSLLFAQHALDSSGWLDWLSLTQKAKY
ncbi:hypothetical protein [Algoriphagus confluentis]|uniref:hypothetical protein n=1 Tax=Algoriphagus confluentis TaxID=1697556 RepID=UPI0030C66F69